MNDAAIHSTKRLLVDIAARDDRAAWDVTTAQRFRERDDIRFEIPMLEAEHLSGASEPALDFVRNKEGAIFPAKLLRAREKGITRRLATLSLHWFDDEGSNIALGQLVLERRDVIECNPRVPLVH